MSDLKRLVHVEVEHFDGQEEGDVGYPYYVVHSDELHFTTQGKTFARNAFDFALRTATVLPTMALPRMPAFN